MKTEIRKVDPNLAASWMTQSSDNRPLRKSHVSYLAKEMKEGRWRLTHQGIAFSPDGKLMDGQHRLRAIQESGTPVSLQVSYYEKGDNITFAFPILDRGLIRNVSDITHIDNKIIQIYNVILGMGTRKSRIPPDDYIIFDTKMGSVTRQFLTACPYQRTYYTPAIVRAAGTMVLYFHKSSLSHISNLFVAWGTGNTINTPPIVNAFMNYIPSLRIGHHIDEQKFFAAATYAMLEKNKDKARLFISNNIQTEVIQEVKNEVDRIMQRQNIARADLIAAKEAKINELTKKLTRKTALDIQAEQAALSMDAKD